MLNAMADLVKRGVIGRLEVINAQARPASAEALGVRTVPWLRIGEIELQGAHSAAELRRWAALATQPSGYAAFLADLLAQGELDRAIGLVRQRPTHIGALAALLGSPETTMAARIGIVAMFEEFAGTALLDPAISPLQELLQAQSPQVRADACHCLGLAGRPQTADAIRPLLADPDPEVQEIARETLEELGFDASRR
jgi:hypothetical protein